MQSWKVWEVCAREEAYQRTDRAPIGGRWIDHNKGDATHPNVRCRYVAKDITKWKDDWMFAATPPLEAIRLLRSNLATRQRGPGRDKGRRKLLLIDVRKAHFHAFVDREVYVDLPLGDRRARPVRPPGPVPLRHPGALHPDPRVHGLHQRQSQRLLLPPPWVGPALRSPWRRLRIHGDGRGPGLGLKGDGWGPSCARSGEARR